MAITTEQRTQLIELYVAIAGRAPDASGLSYWADQMDNNGFTIEQIAGFMYDTDDAKALYPRFLSEEEVATSFYENVLGRTPDAEGLAYWTDKLAENGVVKTLQDMIYSTKMYDGTDAAALVSKQLFADKVEVGTYLAVELKSNDLVAAQNAFDALEAGKTVEQVKGDSISANGQTFTLTTNIDTLNGTSGADTFIGDSGTASAADQISGGAGTDTVKLYGAAAIALPNLSGVEVVENYSNQNLDVSANADVEQLWLYGTGTQSTGNVNQTLGFGDKAGGKALTGVFTSVTGSADAATVAVKDAGATAAQTSLTVAGVEALTVDATGKNQLGNLIAAAAETITVTGEGTVNATLVPGTTVLKSIDATANTGGVTFSLTDAQFGTNPIAITSGAGKDSFTFTDAIGAKATVDLGAGDDSFTITQGVTALTAESVIAAGEGKDTLGLITTTTAINATSGKYFTGFEVADLSGVSSFKVGDVAGINEFKIGGGANTVTNVANDTAFTLYSDTSATQTITLADNSAATSAINVTLDSSTAATKVDIKGAQQVVDTNAHVINVTSEGMVLATVGNHNSLTLGGDSLNQVTNIIADGGQELDITTGAATALTLVDASAATEKVLVDATGATKAMVIKTGDAKDTITSNNVAGTKIYAGGAADAIDLVAAGGAQSVMYTAQADSTSTGFDSISNFLTAQGDQINLSAFGFTGTYDDAVTTKAATGLTIGADSVLVAEAQALNFFADGTAVDRAVAIHDAGNDVYAFVDVNKDGDFSADADMVIKIVGGTDGIGATAAIGDFTFA